MRRYMMKFGFKALTATICCLVFVGLNMAPVFAEEKYPIKTKELLIRDPYVLVSDGRYYMYGTGLAQGNGYGVVVSEDLQNWSQKKNVFTADDSFDGYENFWAPECHYYNGLYYLFATYKSKTSQKRGVAIFSCETPDGEFIPWSDGHITPKNIDCIDGTLYVDESGQPWIVYVNEWTSTPDGIGEMAAMKLDKDLRSACSDPIVLFRANGHNWTNEIVTDGPFIYRTCKGQLLMLWSNFAKSGGYAVGCAKSDNGKIDGIWIQQPEAVYKQDKVNSNDGGHAMLFTDLDGQLTMALHSPNVNVNGEFETAKFIPVSDNGNSIEIINGSEKKNDIVSVFKYVYLSIYYSIRSLFLRLAAAFSIS